MSFFETTHGIKYSVAWIKKITPGKINKEVGLRSAATVELNDGLQVYVDAAEADRITETSGSIIPTYPGFDHLTFWYNPAVPNPETWVTVSPIIGWRDTSDGILPITVEDRSYITAPMAIRYPTGDVRDWECTWEDRAAWERDMKQRADDAHAEAAARTRKTELPGDGPS